MLYHSCIIVASWKWHPVYESPSPPQRGIWVNITTCRLTGLWHCCVQDLQWTPAWDIDRWHHLYLSLSTHLWRTCNTEDKVCTESKAKELSMGSGLMHWMWDDQWSGNVTGRMLMMMVTVWIFGICPPTLKTAMTAHIECLSHQSSYKCWAILFDKYHMEAICYISCD